jgi:hypothetical protein
MNLNDVIIFIYTTSLRSSYAREISKIFKCHDVEHYFVYHKSDKNIRVEPFIEFTDSEVYENISLKTFNCLNFFIKSNKNIFIKINDDCLLDINKLKNLDLTDSNYIGGMIDKTNTTEEEYNNKIHYYKLRDQKKCFPKKLNKIKYMEGSLVILTRELVVHLLNNYTKKDFTNCLENFIGEDERIGLFVSTYKHLKIKNIKMLADLNMDITNDFLSIHPLHFLFFKKLHTMLDSEKPPYLKKINIFNDYTLKEHFFSKLKY